MLEEFGIYLNYVRKLGFEETPDYDFLRELFTKVMKSNGDIDDGVYDWNLLNGEDPIIPLFTLSDGVGNYVSRRQGMGSINGTSNFHFIMRTTSQMAFQGQSQMVARIQHEQAHADKRRDRDDRERRRSQAPQQQLPSNMAPATPALVSFLISASDSSL